MTTTDQHPTSDPHQLREKYRVERDKRIRRDGNEQYVATTGDFSNYVDDPYTPRIDRAPVFDTVEVVIIGGGGHGQQPCRQTTDHPPASGRERDQRD